MWRPPKSSSVHVQLSSVQHARRDRHRAEQRYVGTPGALPVEAGSMRNTLAMVAGMGLMLVTGVAWASQPQFVCVANGTCVFICASDRDCIKAGCILPHCDTHTPDGQLCLSDHAFQFCNQASDCPQGTVCNGNLCETACSP